MRRRIGSKEIKFMFCSSCGAAITPELNYCKRCGAELSGAVAQSKTEIESLIWAIVGITIGGIGVIIGLLVVMKEVIGFDNKLIGLVASGSFFMLLIAEITFVLMLLNRSRVLKKPAVNSQLNEAGAQKLYDAPARELAEAMPVPSVTEHTTRTLDPILREPKKQ
jgi:hypothetical protein